MNKVVNNLKKIYLELTDKCNLNCVTCFRQNWHSLTSDMSDELLMKIVDDIKAIDTVSEIVIGGVGEPTIHSKFIELSYLLRDYKLSVTTNGYYMDEALVACLVDCYDNVIVSVDGLYDNFLRIRGFSLAVLEANVAKIVKRRKQLKSFNPHIIAHLVMSTDNVDDIVPLLSHLRKQEFFQLTLSNLLPQDEASVDKIVYQEYGNEKMKDFLQLMYSQRYINRINVRYPRVELKTERWCDFVENSTTFITCNGSVAPCYRFAHPSVEYVFGRRKEVTPYYFGSLVDNTLKEIWDSANYTDLRVQNYSNRYPSCPDCDLVNCCDYINDANMDCLGHYPSCADCLWTRGFVICF